MQQAHGGAPDARAAETSYVFASAEENKELEYVA